MRRNFNLKDPQFVVRLVLGVLLAANLIAVGLVMFPPGGSPEELEQQAATLTQQVRTARTRLETTKQHVAAVEKGRSEGDQFLSEYFLANRTAFSTLLTELEAAAAQTKIHPRERAYTLEPIEGSDTLSLMSITAGYEGTYNDLIKFVHELDKSPRLLIVESLSAAPQQKTGILTVSMKLDTFVRDAGSRDTGIAP